MVWWWAEYLHVPFAMDTFMDAVEVPVMGLRSATDLFSEWADSGRTSAWNSTLQALRSCWRN